MREASTEAERRWAELVGKDTLETIRDAMGAYAAVPEYAPALTPVRIRFS